MITFHSKLSLFFSIIFLINPFSAESKPPLPPHNFYTVTIPKCGTHLLIKLLHGLTGKRVHYFQHDVNLPHKTRWFFHQHEIVSPVFFENLMKKVYTKPIYVNVHFNFSELMWDFSQKHPRYKKIILIRDLRDAAISMTYHTNREIKRVLGDEASFDEKLSWLLNGGHEFSVFNLKEHATKALKWYQDPSVLVIRFEDLVGFKGGGSQERQYKTAMKLAKFLRQPISPQQLKVILTNLWGHPGRESRIRTFRKGQMGSWREAFTAAHKEEFKKEYGDLLIQFGYEQDNSW